MNDDRRTKETATRVVNGVVTLLLSDADLRQAIANEEITRLVQRGALLPREALQIGSKYELLPVGRMTELEDACRAIVSATDADGAPDRVLVAIREMQAVLEGSSSSWEALDEEPPPPKLKPKKSLRSALKAVPEQEVEEPFDLEPAELAAVVDPASPRPCERCGAENLGGAGDVDQAYLSWTRWRRVLCEKCHQIGPALEGSAQPEESEDVDG